MLTTTKNLLKLNRHNPIVFYNIRAEKERLLNLMKAGKVDTVEGSQLYEDLKALDLPIYNEAYPRLFSEITSRNSIDTLSILRNYKLDFIAYEISIMEELKKFCNNVVATKYVGYNSKVPVQVINELCIRFVEYQKQGSEDCWLYYYWLERMVIRGLRRNIVYKKDIMPAINIILTINKYKIGIINNRFESEPILLEVHTNAIELLNKYLESREVLYEFIQEKEKAYLARYKDDIESRDSINLLYNNFISDKLPFLEVPKSKEESILVEYLELKLEKMSELILTYHTPEEIFSVFKKCSDFLILFNPEEIRRVVIEALHHNEGIFKRYTSTSYEDFVDMNLESLVKAGLLPADDYFAIKMEIIGGK